LLSLEGCKWIDITPLVNSRIAVFPGDTNFKETFHLQFEKGHNLSLSSIETTMHLGAHTDAPSHYHSQGLSIDKRDLSLYLGLCQVITIPTRKKSRIEISDIKTKILAPRVLFRTLSFPDPYQWTNDFMALSTDLIQWLAEQNVRLVGLDTPSVDISDDKELRSHQLIHKLDMAILEGVVLTHVKDGLYDLISLPLNIEGAEATPVRAILLELPKNQDLMQGQ
jgi:arylformamidase